MPPEVRFTDGVRVACHLYPPESVATATGPVPVTETALSGETP
jgi:hypothetical protein